MKIHVNLPSHPYDILIENQGLYRVGEWVASFWQPQKIVIISDNRVANLYAEHVKLQLESQGFQVAVFDFLAGEPSKNLTTIEKIYDFLSSFGMSKADGIIALGGGVVGDLAGFVASTYMRGLHFLQIPTSLIAQVDASIGGKTGVNTKTAKNLLGTFHQPDGVLIDPEVLKTLGERELIEGMGEVIKCALIADINLWQLLEEMAGTRESILKNAEQLIYQSCQVKKEFVLADEYDTGLRHFLNFGHTIGHAIEQTVGYGDIYHGEAVAMGMIQVAKIAEEKGLMAKGISNEIKTMCQKFGLPVAPLKWDKEKLYQAITHDKKANGKQLKLVLVPEKGQPKIESIAIEDVRDYLEKK
ncbi:3-dehydroquinate synthase [Streptococcus zalophi]|uniref:3-dehydroquinate synthase n=1 Tax=Streptococcus zalophi TaxID=640031 RepID=A0A934P8H3_9STRE|nr:3-dehydroquinate synthase [Streptococcus zalophi]MBJ8349136.1 3-dehydroquinate synthase [Streptococcus zalophi]MCR8967712.1 3-dehydroquinate synthase [Streptococcus zalophi]